MSRDGGGVGMVVPSWLLSPRGMLPEPWAVGEARDGQAARSAPRRQQDLEKMGFPGISRQNTPVTPNQSLVFYLYKGALDVGSSHGTHTGLPLKTPEAHPVSEGPHVPQ